MNKWLELRIYAPHEEQNRIIRSFIEPLVNYCDTLEGFTSFHFLSENRNPHLLLRILGEEGVLRKSIKPWMESKKNELNLNGRFTPIGEYLGEEAAFGIEGWVVTYKIFEWASRGEILRLNPDIPKGPLYHEGKLIHCFLNCWGYNILDEFKFHLRSSLERMAVSKGITEWDPEIVKEMIKELENRVIPIISEIVDKHSPQDAKR